MAEGVSARPPQRNDGPPRRPVDGGKHRPPAPDASRRPRPAGPDDRLTTVLPPVGTDTPAHLRDPIDAVKRGKTAKGGNVEDHRLLPRRRERGRTQASVLS